MEQELTFNKMITLDSGTVSKCRPTPFVASALIREHAIIFNVLVHVGMTVPTSMSAEQKNETTYRVR